MQWEKLGSITVLIVDDDAFNRQLIISLLSKIPNINYIEAENGIEALEFLAIKKIDIILLDLHMPKLNGIDTIKEIKRNPIDSLIPIIIITTDELVMKELYDLGANDFLSKPFRLNQLAQKIYKHVVISVEDRDMEITSYLVEAFLELLQYIQEENYNLSRNSEEQIANIFETFNILVAKKNSRDTIYNFFKEKNKNTFNHELIQYFLDYFDYFLELREKYITYRGNKK